MSKEQPISIIERKDSLEEINQTEEVRQEKTPEELRNDNIDRLLQKARQFIAEKKADAKKDEVRKRLGKTYGEKRIEIESKADQMQDSANIERKKGFIVNLKDKYRFFSLKIKGVKHPREMMHLIDYLEEYMPVIKTIRVAKNEVEAAKKRYLKQGYRLEEERESIFVEGKIELYFKKDRCGYKFRKRDIGELSNLLNKSSDAVETFEELRRVGEVSVHLATLCSSKMEKLLRIPNAPSAIRKMSQAGIHCGYITDDKLDTLINLIERDSSEPIFTPQIQERLSRVAIALEGKISIDDFTKLLHIVRDDNLVRIVTILIEIGYIDKSLYNLERVRVFQDQELVKQLIYAYQSGIDIKTLNLESIFYDYAACQYNNNDENKESYERKLNNLKETLKELVLNLMAYDESSKESIDGVVAILGKRCSVSELELVLSVGKNPEGLALLEFLREIELLSLGERYVGHETSRILEKVVSILEDKQLKDFIFQPDFQNFIINAKENFQGKVNLESIQHLDYYNNTFHSPLLEVYKDEFLRSHLLTPEGIELTNHVCQSFPEHTIIEQLKTLLAEPGLINTLRSLESYLGYKYCVGSNKKTIEEVISIHNNPEQKRILFSEKAKNLLGEVKDAQSNLFKGKSVFDIIIMLESLLEKDSEDIIQRIRKNKAILEVSDVFSHLLNGEKIEIEQLKKIGISKLHKIPREYFSLFNGFKEKYALGDKGETIVILVAMLESKKLLEGESGFSWESMLENTRAELMGYQEMIDKKTFDCIPPGLRVSIGMEYEVTKSIQEGYEANNLIGYKNSISKTSNCAKIGIGADSIHEIATQPADNPYLMLLEIKLLQDLGYIDFNFRSPEAGGYYGAATGYHLSVGGEQGIEINHNSYFLSNIISMNNWGGVNFEKEINYVGLIRQRGMDSENVFLLNNKPHSVEIRNFSIDRWEPFERAILTTYNSAIAIQAVERYTSLDYDHIKSLSQFFPASSGELIELLNQQKLVKEPVSDATTEQLIFMWLKLQSDVIKAIKDHNTNFLTNETAGYLDEKNGQWVDSREVSGRDNQRYFREGLENLNKIRDQKIDTIEEFFEKEIAIDQDEIFNEPSAKTANAITRIGNLFLTKFSNFSTSGGVGKKRKADPNVLSFLTNTRENGVKNERRSVADVEKSIFDRNGETAQGYYYLQGGSEKLIIHQTQKLILEFNKNMANLLKSKTSGQAEKREDLSMVA